MDGTGGGRELAIGKSRQRQVPASGEQERVGAATVMEEEETREGGQSVTLEMAGSAVVEAGTPLPSQGLNVSKPADYLGTWVPVQRAPLGRHQQQRDTPLSVSIADVIGPSRSLFNNVAHQLICLFYEVLRCVSTIRYGSM